jgi:hypothetical protein
MYSSATKASNTKGTKHAKDTKNSVTVPAPLINTFVNNPGLESK